MKKYASCQWDLPVIRDMVKRIKSKVGGDMGWAFCSTPCQMALIDSEVLGLALANFPMAVRLSGNGDPSKTPFNMNDYRELRAALLIESGVIDEED